MFGRQILDSTLGILLMYIVMQNGLSGYAADSILTSAHVRNIVICVKTSVKLGQTKNYFVNSNHVSLLGL